MCNRIAIIDKGNLVALDTTQKLLERIQTKKITFKFDKFLASEIFTLKNVQFIKNSNNSVTAIYEKSSQKFEEILKVFKESNLKITDISTEDGDLEDVFVQLTNN